MLKLFVGFDPREAICYHVFCQSVIERSSIPVQFIPLHLNSLKGLYEETHTDGSNAFIYSRFLIPALCNFQGWAIWADGDMVCLEDVAELVKLRDPSKAVQVVKHEYRTKHPIKYLGARNDNYPRKNWSSLILWNCAHPDNKVLTPEFVQSQVGSYLHRFQWLRDEEIGDLPKEWNWLAMEYPENPEAKLVHHTIGSPCFSEYRDSEMSDCWHQTFNNAIQPLDQPKGVYGSESEVYIGLAGGVRGGLETDNAK